MTGKEGRAEMTDILIVDDERDIRELVGDILRDEGFQTRLADNSDDAMAEINESPPALLILDIWLKDSRMDGIDILKTVKREHPGVPIVIISGHGNIEIAVAAMHAMRPAQLSWLIHLMMIIAAIVAMPSVSMMTISCNKSSHAFLSSRSGSL